MRRKSLIQYFDPMLMGVVGGLLLVGLMTLYSSIYMGGEDSQLEIFWRQVFWLGIGLAAMGVGVFMPLKVIRRAGYPLWIISVVLLLLVLIVPQKGNEIGRWISFMGFRMQPSELAKLGTILALARFLGDSKSPYLTLKMMVVCGALVLIPTVLVQQQPDLGTCLVFVALLFPMLYWAGMPHFGLFAILTPAISILAVIAPSILWFVGWLAVLAVITLWARQRLVVMLLLLLMNTGVGIGAPYVWDQLKPYQQQRIQAFLNPELDPRGAGYHLLQSQTAIGSGGITGKGYLAGTQTHLRFLPEQHTDFIFSVLGEEFGFLGVLMVLTLFFLLIQQGIAVAVNARDPFAGYCAIGISTVFLVHVFVNIGMTVGLVPVTGLPLSFLSYGGSALVVNLLMIGILNNASIHRLDYF